jgi:ribonuclease P protein component
MPQKGHGFAKNERLCSLKLIEELFKSGNVLFQYPYRIIWKEADSALPTPSQIVIAVPKRNFKRAVDRNLIKRRIREGFRLQKEILYVPLSEKGVSIIFMVQYTGKEIAGFIKISEAMTLALKKLADAACGTAQC